MTFEKLNLIPQLLHSLKAKGYTAPTAIQQKAIPHILEGKDIFGSAQTGTGKTAVFALPILQLIYTNKKHSPLNPPKGDFHAQSSSLRGDKRGAKALILAPTRELAQQISDSFRDYGRGLNIRHTVIYGGVSQRPQTDALRNGVDILIATPGRLLDLINQGYVHLEAVEFFVLDEVDRMLDMGFINDIKKIIPKLAQKKQTLFFSATFPTEIKKLADSLLHHPVMVQTDAASSTAVNVKQYVYFVPKEQKKVLLANILAKEPNSHVLVFTRTKRGADRLVKNLSADNIRAEAIHGDKSQGARQRALNFFKSRKINLLIATDVASRGIDVTDISHVINYDLPEEAEVYVHRIGRTGRAGAKGIAISFCSHDERYLMKDINKLAGNKIETVQTPAFSKEELQRAQTKTPVYQTDNRDDNYRERRFSSPGNNESRGKNFQRDESRGNSYQRHDRSNNTERTNNSTQGNSSAQPERKFRPRKKKWHGKWQGKRSSHSHSKQG